MIKSGVLIYGIKPEMVLCHSIADNVFEANGYGCVATSVVGKKHKDRSLHPVGYAEDFRTKHIKTLQEKLAIVDQLKEALPCCDVILEHVDKDQEHIHMEFDPKDDAKFQRDKMIYKQTGQWPDSNF